MSIFCQCLLGKLFSSPRIVRLRVTKQQSYTPSPVNVKISHSEEALPRPSLWSPQRWCSCAGCGEWVHDRRPVPRALLVQQGWLTAAHGRCPRKGAPVLLISHLPPWHGPEALAIGEPPHMTCQPPESEASLCPLKSPRIQIRAKSLCDWGCVAPTSSYPRTLAHDW